MENKTFNFWGKTFAVALTAAVAGVAMVACSDDEEKEQIIPTKEVELLLHFGKSRVQPGETYDAEKIFNKVYMDSLMSQPDVKNIILKLAGRWGGADQEFMHDFCDALKNVQNIAPEKFKGQGDFVLRGLPRGTMSENDQAIADSLWFTSVGFTFLGQQ